MCREKVLKSIRHQIFFVSCSLMTTYMVNVESIFSFITFFMALNAVFCAIVHVEFTAKLRRIVLTEGNKLDKFLDMFTHKDKLNFWVAETKSSQIVGCVGVIYRDVDTMPKDTKMYMLMKKYGIKSSFELKRMSVDRNHRKNGVAGMLMQNLIESITEDYEQVNDVMLATNELLKPAIKLYKRFGFAEMSPLLTVENWYSKKTYNVHFFRLSLPTF